MAQLQAAAATDRGRLRKRNEDAFLVEPTLGLALVADGMGGHPAGDVASRLAAQELRDRLADPSDPGSPSAVGARMAEAVRRADARVRAEGVSDPARAQMGTTLTSLLVLHSEGQAILGHVGDSRAYLYDDGRLRQLTRDHTWVQQQIDRGLMSPTEARGHPWGHVLAQAIGVGEGVEPDVTELETRAGQVYLLCSDGLTNMLDDAAIARTLAEHLPSGLDETARALVDAANEGGGADNITVVLVRI